MRYAEITNRGFTIVALTAARGTVELWHLDPFSREPTRSAHLGAAFVVDPGADPPKLDPLGVAEIPTEPWRPTLPQPLPARPSGRALRRMRRRDRARRPSARVKLASRIGALAGGTVAVVVAARRAVARARTG